MTNINSKKILGVDFGAKRVGIAISDENGNFALPKLVLNNDKSLLENIGEIIKKDKVIEIVIGESTDYKGKENPIMKDVKEFAKELEGKLNLPISFEPEFLTTHQAKNIQGKGEMTDASAAALILQSFLDKRNVEKCRGEFK
jgi:putative Holliday junction resolvase|tara:strand:- start:34908 stop:35333 length:426 start_codon:yes stop_codon:yes gene_type:complete